MNSMIDLSGKVCLVVGGENWTPIVRLAYDFFRILRRPLLGDPRRNRRKFRHRGLWSNGTVNRLKDF